MYILPNYFTFYSKFGLTGIVADVFHGHRIHNINKPSDCTKSVFVCCCFFLCCSNLQLQYSWCPSSSSMRVVMVQTEQSERPCIVPTASCRTSWAGQLRSTRSSSQATASSRELWWVAAALLVLSWVELLSLGLLVSFWEVLQHNRSWYIFQMRHVVVAAGTTGCIQCNNTLFWKIQHGHAVTFD